MADCIHDPSLIRSHEENFKEIKEDIRDMKRAITDVTEIAKANQLHVSSFEKHTDAIVRMGTAVEIQTLEIKKISKLHESEKERNDTQDTKLYNLELKPGALATRAWTFVIVSVAGILLGAALNNLLLHL